ncbi:MAG TPA: hypothetical protein VGP64_12305 [Polyangia bacterium]|jgi:hypothetical protein
MARGFCRAGDATTRLSTVLAAASLLGLGCAHRAPFNPGGPYSFVDRPHPCAAAPPAALDALRSKAELDGCLEDVHLRAGTSPEAEILFTCPASVTPMIILHGRGHTRYRPPDNALDRQRLARELPEPARDRVHDLAYYGPGYAGAPPCTTAGRGLVMSIHGYEEVDGVVDRLRAWIQADDLDIELTILLTPAPADRGPPFVIPGWD